jgi:ATP-dependent helicase HrpB
MSRLETVRISRASADQRRGRAGRTAPGTCYRLWSESEHAALAPQSAPEMLEADLGPLALELACWGVTDPAALAWVDVPPLATFRQARALLRDLEALDDRGQATLVGRRRAAQGVHPRLAHMLLRALPLGLARLACEVAALLTERDPLRSVGSLPEPDLRHRIDVLRDAAPPPGTAVDRDALQRVRRTADLLERRLRRDAGVERDTTSGTLEADDAVGLLLAFAYPDRIGVARRGDSGRYLLTHGRGATLVGPAALARSELIVAASIDAGDREARIQLGAPLRRELLERHFAAALEARDEVAWDSRTGSVVARRVRRLGAVVLEEQALAGASVQGIEQAMVDGVREMGLESLPWTGELQQWRARVRLLRSMDLEQDAQTDWPDVSDTHLLATLEAWLGPYLAGITRRSQLVNVRLRDALSGLLDWTLRRRLDELAPTHVTVPSGSRIPVDYVQASPTLAVRLQEVFGWLDSPRIAAGRLPLTLELLSPARRPVQVTRDLLSFWRHGYAEVRKELRGRYPKHYWPEDPLIATPTRKVRPPAST